MKGIKYIIAYAITCISCTQKHFNTEQELRTYLKTEKRGYTQHKHINGVDYVLTYRPTDLLVSQELGDSSDRTHIAHLREKYHEYMYFDLSMSKNNHELLNSVAGNRDLFGAMVHRLSFDMNSNVHLYAPGKDTLSMIDYSYPRMYGTSRSTTMLFVYPRTKNALQNEQLYFTVGDLGFQTGEVRFSIRTALIKNEPQLVF